MRRQKGLDPEISGKTLCHRAHFTDCSVWLEMPKIQLFCLTRSRPRRILDQLESDDKTGGDPRFDFAHSTRGTQVIHF